MAKEKFTDYSPTAPTLELIAKCNDVIEDMVAQGYDLTLRQLYYQLVAAAEIPNNQKSYNRLGDIISKARLGGLVDWDAIIDRTRNLTGLRKWRTPADLISHYSYLFHIDRWKGQEFRPEVWIEKDALAGVFQRICNKLDVDYFSCRGYTSLSEMKKAADRFARRRKNGQEPIILHFGDHDPSGLDMTRDIQDRLDLFAGGVGHAPKVVRMALNMDQVDKYDPPPNPTKIKDSRSAGYIREYGSESWELDALRPDVLSNLVEMHVMSIISDRDKWSEREKLERSQKNELREITNNYDIITEILKNVEYVDLNEIRAYIDSIADDEED